MLWSRLLRPLHRGVRLLSWLHWERVSARCSHAMAANMPFLPCLLVWFRFVFVLFFTSCMFSNFGSLSPRRQSRAPTAAPTTVCAPPSVRLRERMPSAPCTTTGRRRGWLRASVDPAGATPTALQVCVCGHFFDTMGGCYLHARAPHWFHIGSSAAPNP